jgi:hypothetical protein
MHRMGVAALSVIGRTVGEPGIITCVVVYTTKAKEPVAETAILTSWPSHFPYGCGEVRRCRYPG